MRFTRYQQAAIDAAKSRRHQIIGPGFVSADEVPHLTYEGFVKTCESLVQRRVMRKRESGFYQLIKPHSQNAEVSHPTKED